MDFKDRRIFERIELELPLNYPRDECVGESCVNTHDISAEGVGITSENELAPGDALKVYLKVPITNKAFPVQGKVIWSKRSGNSFRAGISLDQVELMEFSAILRFLHPPRTS
jgi:hypothetical protein